MYYSACAEADHSYACFPFSDFSREQAKSKCDWAVMLSVFVASHQVASLSRNRLQKDQSLTKGSV
jgi:hypothetical protein